MSFAVLGAVLIAAAPAALRLDLASDSGLPCPAHAALGEALRARLPGLRVELEGGTAAADLAVELARAGTGWSILLRRGDGREALRRQLPLGERECGLLGQTGALVIDRFLEDIHWEGRPTRIAPLPSSDPPAQSVPITPPSPGAEPAAPITPTNGPAPIAFPAQPAPMAFPAQPAPITLPAQPAPIPAPARIDQARPLDRPATHRPADFETRPGPEHHLSIALGGGAWLGAPGDLRAATSLSLELRRGERLQLGVLALFAAASSRDLLIEAQLRGSTRVQQGLLALSGGLCAAPAGFTLCGGALAGVRGSLGSSSGQRLFQQTSAALFQPELGGVVTLSRRLAARFEVALEVIAAAPLGAASFQVSGADSPRALAGWDLAATLRLGWVAF